MNSTNRQAERPRHRLRFRPDRRVLARALSASSADFVVVEAGRSARREARALGYLCVQGDATDEDGLLAAGMTRARALATVLAERRGQCVHHAERAGAQPRLEIIARGEVPSTESKLLQAGANKVVLPTHIGAERIAELCCTRNRRGIIEGLERSPRLPARAAHFGLELEVVTAAPQSPAVRMTVAAIERHAKARSSSSRSIGATATSSPRRRATAVDRRRRRRRPDRPPQPRRDPHVALRAAGGRPARLTRSAAPGGWRTRAGGT